MSWGDSGLHRQGLHCQVQKGESGEDLRVGALLHIVLGSCREPRTQHRPSSIRCSSRVDDGNVTHHELLGNIEENALQAQR
jgi:hypothetical protein